MTFRRRNRSLLPIAAVLLMLLDLPAFATVAAAKPSDPNGKPLKVYILAGQSNMVGTGAIKTFDYIGDDPKTAPLLEQMRGLDGTPYVCKRVWISYLNGRQNQYGDEGIGRLTAGYGLREKDKHSEPWDYVGPEYMFGITMERNYDGPILIIKTAWGGQSLSVDFRSPSAGPYELNDFQRKLYGEQGRLDQIREAKKEQTGQNYRWMIEHVKKVLGDIKRVYPDYRPSCGYEVAGFVWFQGFNDLIDSHTYPKSLGTKRYDLYSELLAHFIRDVRRDLDAPDMKFVIGVAGQNGNFTPGSFDTRGEPERWLKVFRQAMASPASMPEFRGNVAAVQTSPYWDVKLGFISMKQLKVKWMSNHLRDQHKGYANESGAMTRQEQQEYLAKYRKELITPEEELLLKRAASTGGSIHYFGSAKFHAQAGQAFAEAMLAMEGN